MPPMGPARPGDSGTIAIPWDTAAAILRNVDTFNNLAPGAHNPVGAIIRNLLTVADVQLAAHDPVTAAAAAATTLRSLADFTNLVASHCGAAGSRISPVRSSRMHSSTSGRSAHRPISISTSEAEDGASAVEVEQNSLRRTALDPINTSENEVEEAVAAGSRAPTTIICARNPGLQPALKCGATSSASNRFGGRVP